MAIPDWTPYPWYKFWNPNSGMGGGFLMALIVILSIVLAAPWIYLAGRFYYRWVLGF